MAERRPLALVTGASSGIGLELAREFARNGFDVPVTALQPGPTDTEFFDRAGMQDTRVAGADKDDPADVARQGFEAMMAGKDHVVAGSPKNKAQAAASRVLPETTRAAMHAAQTRPREGEEPG
jgi:uncharacterized protein